MKASLRNAIRRKIYGDCGCCYCFLFEKKTVKRSVQRHVFAQSPPDRRPHDKHPVKSSHRSDLCRNVSSTVLFGSNCNSWGTAVAQWLRYCATNRKVAGSIAAGVSGFFIDIKSFRSHYGPGVDSAS